MNKSEGIIRVLVEIPKGSRNKYEYNHEIGGIILDRVLHSPVHYPADYGFICNTLADDGDELDALVLITEPTFPGCLIDVRPVGILNMADEKGIDQKVLCVPVGDPFWNTSRSLKDIPPHMLREIEHFFTIYKLLEEKKTVVEGWEDVEMAQKMIVQAQNNFQNK